MAEIVLACCLSLPVGSGPVETRFAQVAPRSETPAAVTRLPGQQKAVVLITGLHLHLIRESETLHARFAPWQRPGSYLVSLLAEDADVFSFTYAQSVPITEIARLPDLAESVERLRQAGYSEIVLVGHSAGGLVVRQFVEEHPEAGVTKVVQVSAPNTDSGWAELVDAVRSLQKPFVDSLRKGARASWEEREGRKPLRPHVQFVCIVSAGLGRSDGVVSVASQWPKDLRDQGVPAVVFRGDHGSVVSSRPGACLIAETVRQDQPRWTTEQVETMRQRLHRWAAEGRQGPR